MDIDERARFRHEARTLLNHAVGYAELLASDAVESADDSMEQALIEIRSAALRLRKPAIEFIAAVTESSPFPDALKQEVYACLYDVVCLVQAARRNAPAQGAEAMLEDVRRVHEAVNDLANLFEETESKGGFKGELPVSLPYISGGTAKRSGRILVVDDDQFGRDLLSRHLERQGHTVCQANSGKAAFDILIEAPFDIVILDIMMPGMSGFQFLETLKHDEHLRDTSVLVVSALDDPASTARCIEYGAEDYLPRDFDPSILKARIDSLLEKKEYKLRNDLAMRRLVETQLQLAGELKEAAGYVKSLLPRKLDWHDVAADWEFIPSLSLGGDSFYYHSIDDDHLAIFLLDVSGHGIQAALLSATIMNMLRSLALGGLDYGSPSSVLARLNASFHVEEQNNMFFTIWYGVYDAKEKILHWAGAGSPPAIMVGPDGSVSELSGDGPVIGVDGSAVFSDFHQPVAAGSHLYLFSDGLYEVRTGESAMLPWEDFLGLLLAHHRECSSAPHCLSPIRRIVDAVKGLSGRDIFDDDVSIVEFAFNA
ncbi:MAG: fused response regulator/phosphatase [Spirochaetia bacterium]|jgi:sigma-B regulation protein RsbU (phosphoserine phosphatase)|nr:fused response regulator/phosphatase [Spirochaetia bacterium]